MARKNMGGAHSRSESQRPRRVVDVPAGVLRSLGRELAQYPACTITHERGPSWHGLCGRDDLEYRLVLGRGEPTYCCVCGRSVVDGGRS